MKSFLMSQCCELLGLVERDRRPCSPSGVSRSCPSKNSTRRLTRPGRERLSDLLLEAGDEVGVGLVGHDGQLVDVVDSDGVVHALAVLVDGQAKAAADLLAARDGVVALLEHAHHEDVGVVPALAQRRVGEDEPHRLVEGEQPLLVLEDQVVGVDVRRLARFVARTSRRRVDRGAWSSCRSRSSPRGRLDVVALQVVLVRVGRVVEVELAEAFRRRRVVLLLEDAGVVAERVLAVVVAVLRDLVDEEQRQHLDALREELALLVEVGADDLADLDAALRLLGDVRSASCPATIDVAVAELDDVRGWRRSSVTTRSLVCLDAAGEVVEVRALCRRASPAA